MNVVPNIDLNSGNAIPQLGFGVFQIPPEETERAVLQALEVGYRHVDTAQGYGNEAEVGAAVRRSGIDRDELFVTSKLHNQSHGAEAARRGFEDTLRALDADYIDLFLIHWPVPKQDLYVETWRSLERLHGDERARSIGVSNFTTAHLVRLQDETGTAPAVNQIQIHPYFTQDDLRAFDTAAGIANEAWAPIAQGKVLDDPVVDGIARRLGRSPAQVVLRWHVQRGDIVIPKSTTPSRIKENFALFDFELEEGDIAAITALDRGDRIGPDPEDMD